MKKRLCLQSKKEPIAMGIGIGNSRAEAFADAMENVERIKAGGL